MTSNNSIQKSIVHRKQRMVLSKRTGRRQTYLRVPFSLLKSIPRHGMYVFVYTFYDAMCTLVDGITPRTTVAQLKDRIAQVHGLGAWQQRLFFQGKRLELDRTLESYCIDKGAFVHVTFAL